MLGTLRDISSKVVWICRKRDWKAEFWISGGYADTSHATKATPKTNIPMRAKYTKFPHEWGFNMLESKKRYTDRVIPRAN